LTQDHHHAECIAAALRSRFAGSRIDHATNMVHLALEPATYQNLRTYLAGQGIKVGRPRWVFHLDVSPEDVEKIASAIRAF